MVWLSDIWILIRWIAVVSRSQRPIIIPHTLTFSNKGISRQRVVRVGSVCPVEPSGLTFACFIASTIDITFYRLVLMFEARRLSFSFYGSTHGCILKQLASYRFHTLILFRRYASFDRGSSHVFRSGARVHDVWLLFEI